MIYATELLTQDYYSLVQPGMIKHFPGVIIVGQETANFCSISFSLIFSQAPLVSGFLAKRSTSRRYASLERMLARSSFPLVISNKALEASCQPLLPHPTLAKLHSVKYRRFRKHLLCIFKNIFSGTYSLEGKAQMIRIDCANICNVHIGTPSIIDEKYLDSLIFPKITVQFYSVFIVVDNASSVKSLVIVKSSDDFAHQKRFAALFLLFAPIPFSEGNKFKCPLI